MNSQVEFEKQLLAKDVALYSQSQDRVGKLMQHFGKDMSQMDDAQIVQSFAFVQNRLDAGVNINEMAEQQKDIAADLMDEYVEPNPYGGNEVYDKILMVDAQPIKEMHRHGVNHFICDGSNHGCGLRRDRPKDQKPNFPSEVVWKNCPMWPDAVKRPQERFVEMGQGS